MEPATVEVRFSDCDLMGHVNNAVYFTYFEQARMYYLENILNNKWDWKKDGIILVNNQITYLKPVFLYDKPHIYVSLEKIGNKSFTLKYVMKVNENTVAEGTSKLVSYDFTKRESVEVNPIMKEALLKLNY